MRHKIISILFSLLSLMVIGCTTYIYQGKIQATDSTGKNRQFVVFWNKTSRTLWFDSTAGSVSLLTECSANTVEFDEQPNGIFFRKRPSDVMAVPVILPKDVCGEIFDKKRIRDLKEGYLPLSIYCKPTTKNEFALQSAISYLKASENPYIFPITRIKTEDLANDTPKRPPCRS